MRVFIAVLLTGIMLSIIGCGPSESEFTSFGSYQSPDKAHTLELDIARGRTVYSPVTLRVNLHATDSEDPKYMAKTKIAHDGGEITGSNIQVSWIRPDTVQLCLSGVEQEDQVLEIDVVKQSHRLLATDCSK